MSLFEMQLILRCGFLFFTTLSSSLCHKMSFYKQRARPTEEVIELSRFNDEYR